MSDSTDTADLKKQLKAALASYHKATENADTFEAKLKEAKRAEVDAVTDSEADERVIVKRISEAQGLAAVYSRRAEVAKAKIPEAFAAIQPIVKALTQDLTNRCYALAAERVSRHREVFRARFDLETFHRRFLSSLPAFPVDYESDLDQLVGCCPDVANARACVPLLIWTINPVHDKWGLTIERIEEDIARLNDAERVLRPKPAKSTTSHPFPK